MANSLKKIIPLFMGICLSVCAYAQSTVNLYFFVNGVEVTSKTVTKGVAYDLSTVTTELASYLTGCRDYEFYGWKTDGNVAPGETPAVITSITPPANTNLYAVFRNTGAAANQFKRITSASDLELDAEYLVVCYYDHDGDIYYGPQYYAMNSTSSTNRIGATQIFPEAGAINVTNDNIIWTLGGTEDAWTWQNKGNKYWYMRSTSYDLLNTYDSYAACEISASKGIFSFKKGDYYMSYSDDDDDYFKLSTSNNWDMYLYKRVPPYTSFPNCDQKWNIIFNAVEGTVNSKDTVHKTESPKAGDGVALASLTVTPPPCGGWTFSGWHVDEPIRGQESPSKGKPNVPALHKTGTYIPNYNDETLYAVYETTSYKLVTSASELTTGDVCVIVYNDANNYTVNYNNSNTSWTRGSGLTIADNKITAGVTAAMQWTYSGSYFYSTTDDNTHKLAYKDGGTYYAFQLNDPNADGFQLRYKSGTKTYYLRSQYSQFERSTTNSYNRFKIYRKTTTYTSYPHCSKYKAMLIACGGTINGKARDEYEEDGPGAGFILPAAVPSCPESGWRFAGWIEGGDIGLYTDVKFDDVMAVGETYYPSHDGVNLYAVYRRLTDRFRIVAYGTAAGLEMPMLGDNYLITYYDKSTTIDWELSSVYKTANTTLSAVEGHSPPLDDTGFELQQPDSALWWKVGGSEGAWTFENVNVKGQYLNIANNKSTLGASQSFTITPNASVSVDGNRNLEIKSNSSNKYIRYTSGYFYGGDADNSSNKYHQQCYLYRQIKEYSSYPRCAPFRVYFDGRGGTAGAEYKDEEVAGEGFELPGASPNDCARDGWAFAGWAEAPVTEETKTLSFNLYPAHTNFRPTKNNMTLYAVYYKKEHKYKKILSIDDLYLGVNYIVSSGTNAVKNVNNSTKIDKQTIPPGNTITVTDAAVEWLLTGAKGEYVFYNAANTCYWDLTTGGQGRVTQDKDADNFYIKQVTSGQFTIRSNKTLVGYGGKMTMYYNNGFITNETGTNLTIFQQQATYLSDLECADAIDALKWTKEGDKYYVYVESYTQGAIPRMDKSEGSPELITSGDMMGTWKINYDPTVLTPCSETSFTWGTEDAKLKIPHLIVTDKNASELPADCSTCDVVVADGATLTFNANRTIHVLTVYDGGTVNVETGKTLTANSLILSSDMLADNSLQKAPKIEMTGTGAINLPFEDLYRDMRIDEDRYYWFSMPFDVDNASISYANVAANGKAPVYRTDYYVKYYNGLARANDADNGTQKTSYWTHMADRGKPFTLKAGLGYQIGIPDQKATDQADGNKHAKRVIRFTMKPNRTTWNAEEKNYQKAAVVEPSECWHPLNKVHAGWNLIGNPYLRAYTGGSSLDGNSGMQNGAWEKEIVEGVWTRHYVLDDGQSTTVPYFTVYNQMDQTYSQELASSYRALRPFEALFVQINTGNSIYFKSSGASRNMPKYLRAQASDMPVRTGIKLSGMDKSDKTGFAISEDYTPEYEIGADLVKYANNGRLNLYSLNMYNQTLSFNGLSEEDAENPIPVGVTFPVSGEYTFEFDYEQYSTNEIESLILIDKQEGMQANLKIGTYTFTTNAGTVDNRFAIIIRLAKDVITDIDPVGYEQGQPRKIIQDGHLFILHENEMYNAMGGRVR